MTKNVLLPTLACVLALVGDTGLQAQVTTKLSDKDTTPEVQMGELYKKMATILSGGRPEKDTMLILANPGLVLGKGFDTTKAEDQQILDEIVDQVPAINRMFTPVPEARLSNIYKAILENKQLKEVAFTENEKERLAAAYAMTDPDQEPMATYLRLRNKALAAQAAVSSARLACNEAIIDQREAQKAFDQSQDAGDKKKLRAANAEVEEARIKLDMKVETYNLAKRTWDNQGKVKEIDAATDTIRSLGAKSGGAWWNSLSEKLRTAEAKKVLANFYPAPGTWTDANNQDWTYISYKFGEKIDESQLKNESWDVNVVGSSGWFSIDSHTSSVDMAAKDLMKHKDFSITFEAKRINVYRPWLDSSIFLNDAWKMPENADLGVISYGSLLNNRKATQRDKYVKKDNCAVPLVVTTLYIIRNLKLNVTLTQIEKEKFQKSFDTEHRVGLGPITISGGYHKMDKGSKAKATITPYGIECNGIQIVGYQAAVLPQSPLSYFKK